MSNTKRWIEDLEEKFYDEAAKLVKDSEVKEEALKKCEALRAKELPWMDASDVEELVEDFWHEYTAEYV